MLQRCNAIIGYGDAPEGGPAWQAGSLLIGKCLPKNGRSQLFCSVGFIAWEVIRTQGKQSGRIAQPRAQVQDKVVEGENMGLARVAKQAHLF